MDRARFIAIVVFLFIALPALAAPPHLVVLSPTGQMREGLPVLTRHRNAAPVGTALTRGFAGHLLRLYAMEQEFLRQRTGHVPEPAYLLLSDRQGGFPQFGFYLDAQKKADAGWVDLHRSSRISGTFGAMDQIFPHELLHVIVRQLAGEPRESGGNQVHAIGVRTDPATAFAEGFAEHVQILAVDDPDAVSDTRALHSNADVIQRARDNVAQYADGLTTRWWPVRPSQIRFLLWFSQSEQVQRYDAVKANLYARTTVIPPALLTARDKYDAYLYQCVVPGAPDGPAKSASVMLSTEGVVAHLFWKLVTTQALQRRYQDEAFYAQFGVATADVAPLENVFLKLFFALAEGRPSTVADLLRSYIRLFPSDALDVEHTVRAALLGQTLPDAPELWLANDGLVTGTSLFDQFRGLPRLHTFDVNAASNLDWLSVDGVTADMAARLTGGAPYASLESLLRSSSLPDQARQRIQTMARSMDELRARSAGEDESLSLGAVARPYLWRLGLILLVASASGAWLARTAGIRRAWTAAPVGLAAALLVMLFAWVVTCPPWYPLAAPVLLGGLPWALWRVVRERAWRPAALAVLVWLLAAVPAFVMTRAW